MKKGETNGEKLFFLISVERWLKLIWGTEILVYQLKIGCL